MVLNKTKHAMLTFHKMLYQADERPALFIVDPKCIAKFLIAVYYQYQESSILWENHASLFINKWTTFQRGLEVYLSHLSIYTVNSLACQT